MRARANISIAPVFEVCGDGLYVRGLTVKRCRGRAAVCGITPGRETESSFCWMCDAHPDCSPAGSEGAPRQPCSSGPFRGDGGGGGGGRARGGQRGPQSGASLSEHHHQPPGFSQRAGTTSSTPCAFNLLSRASGSHQGLVDYKDPISIIYQIFPDGVTSAVSSLCC